MTEGLEGWSREAFEGAYGDVLQAQLGKRSARYEEILQAKKARLAGKPDPPLEEPVLEDLEEGKLEALERGVCVLYWGARPGVVHETFSPLDELWVKDSASGKLVADSDGNAVQFRAAGLEIVRDDSGIALTGDADIEPAADLPPPPQPGAAEASPEPAGNAGGPRASTAPAPAGNAGPTHGAVSGSVLLVGWESQMTEVLQHFGPPDTRERRNPQQLLAIPSHMCDPSGLLATVSPGISEELTELAQELCGSADPVPISALHLEEAIKQLGPDLMHFDEPLYVMASMQLPRRRDEAKDASDEPDEDRIDITVTATGAFHDEVSPGAAAYRALVETCGVKISYALWGEPAQKEVRRELGVRLPLWFSTVDGVKTRVIVLPRDVAMATEEGALCIAESPDEDGPALDKEKALPEPKVNGKTIGQWDRLQHQFASDPPLPPGWLRIVSRKKGEVYFFNKMTRKATFDFPEAPLPEGWTKQVSKSTGKVYYFHAKKRESTFVRPVAK